jgi:hypothetical protein
VLRLEIFEATSQKRPSVAGLIVFPVAGFVIVVPVIAGREKVCWSLHARQRRRGCGRKRRSLNRRRRQRLEG